MRIPRFLPSTSMKMNHIFKNKVQEEEGSNWTKVTPEMKDNYWEEFKKYFIWARGAEETVKNCWKKNSWETLSRFYKGWLEWALTSSVFRHTGGSITASEHVIRFEMKNRRIPTCNELFEITQEEGQVLC